MLNPIKKARLIEGLTQIELAKRLDVSPGAVCHWETGRYFPEVGRLKRIASVLHITVEELVKGFEGKEAG